jgi:myxalamid-type polyketide synthase MxaE and MxaD
VSLKQPVPERFSGNRSGSGTLNIADWSEKNLQRFGDYDAIVDGDRVWGARELHESSCRLEAALVEQGIAPGNRVLLLLPLSAEIFITSLAVWRSGGVVILGNCRSPAAEIESIIQHSEPSAIAGSPSSLAGLEIPPSVRTVILVGKAQRRQDWLPFEELASHALPIGSREPRAPDDEAQIIFTSGTTGTPKGVVYTHRSIHAHLRYLAALRKLSRTPDSGPEIHALPPSSFGGVVLTSRFVANRTYVLLDEFDAGRILSAVERHRATSMVLVPSMCEAFLSHGTERYDCTSLRSLAVGGAHVSVSLANRIQRQFGLPPTVLYGTTEAGGGIASNALGRNPASVGNVQLGVKIRIIDENGSILSPGEVGEIQTQTPWSAQGYFRDSRQTEKVFQQGWVRTSDLGYLDANGDLFIVGRRNEMIIQSGVNIYPQELVDIIRRLPAVKECAVIGVPDPFVGEEAVACVVVHPGVPLGEQQILVHCAGFLEERKIPARVRFLDSLPHTPNGKVTLSKLREQLLMEKQAVVETRTVQRIRAAPSHQRVSIIIEMLERELGRQLPPGRISVSTELPGNNSKATFRELGLTSLGAVRFAAKLSELFGHPFPATLTFQHPDFASLAESILAEIVPVPRAVVASENNKAVGADESIAIVGIACRLPGGADTPGKFWELLRRGGNPVSEWPSQRGQSARRSHRRAAFLEEADLFDAAFFRLGVEPTKVDPQQRVFLEVSWEALEDAGLNSVSGRKIGVFLGISGNGYASGDGLGVAPSMAVARLCHFLNLTGPAVSIDTSCSSSLTALHSAAQSLRVGESEAAIAAGVSVIADPVTFVGLQQVGVLAPDGRSKTFDASADGYGRGEGCVVLVLKRLSDALRHKDRIHAILRGSALNHDGKSSSITAPNPHAQENVIREALRLPGISPADVQYVETHGTGTLLGDPIEVQGLTAVFEGRSNPLAIGSVKSNIGHLEPAAGLAGVLKTILALKYRQLPASLHFQHGNPHIPWKSIPIRVQSSLGEWPQPKQRLIAGVSSFGMSGTNAHVVLEEAVAGDGASAPATPVAEQGALLLPVSAQTPDALKDLVNRYIAWFENACPEEPNFRDISYTASCRRVHMEYRIAVLGRNRSEWREKLVSYKFRATESAGFEAVERRRIVMVFSGQGSQWCGMGRELLENESIFRVAMEECAAQIDRHTTWKLLDELARDEAGTRISETEVAQPALFAFQVALYRLWKAWGVEPNAVIGHSLGEIAAAYSCGALSLESAARLVVERGRIMQRVSGFGKTLSVDLSARDVRAQLADFPGLQICATNGPRITAVCGATPEADEFQVQLTARGVRWKEVSKNFAFHSNQLDESAKELTEVLGSAATGQPEIFMISTVSAESASHLDAVYWGEQIRQPVRFHEAICKALNEGHDTFIEVGPHPMLLPAIAQTIDDHGRKDEHGNGPLLLASIRRTTPERESMLEALGSLYSAGHRVVWEKQYTTPGRVVDLPSYPWQHESYWTTETQERQQSTPRAGMASFLDRHIQAADEPGKHLFEVSIDLKNPKFAFITNHKVMGDVSFPPSAFLEFVWQGAALAYREERVRALGDIRFERTLSLTDNKTRLLQLVLRQESENLNRFRVFSRAAEEGDDAFVEHLHGIVRTGDQAQSPDAILSLSELHERCRHPFELQAGHAEALTKLEPPRRAPAGKILSGVAASVLDGDIYAVARGKEALQAPETLEQLIVRGPSTRAAWQYTRRSVDAGAGTTQFDVWVLDEKGIVLVQAKGLALKVSSPHSLDQYLYEVIWREAPRLIAKPPGSGSWLLLSNQGAIGDELRSKLESYGRQVITLRAGEAFARQDATHFTCDPNNAADFDQLFAAAFPDRCPSVLIHLWSLDLPPTESTRPQDLEEAQRLGCLSAMHLVQALSRRSWDQLPTLFLITQGAQMVNNAITSVAQAPLWGFGASLAHEMPDLRTTLIDLDPDSARIGRLFEELFQADGEDRIALRGEARWVARFVPLKSRTDSHPSVRPDRTYLITGGLGGLGLVIAQRLVDLGARHLILMGRTGPTAQACSQIARLEAAGAEVSIALADVSNRDDLARAVQDLEVHMPRLAGVVHAAGVLDDGVVLNLTAERFRAVLAPKVAGAWNLHNWCRDKHLDFFVFFSSIAGVLGSPGQSHYAAANAFLDALAHTRTNGGLAVQTIDWGGWGETGMATRIPDGRRQTMGTLISNVLGADLFERILAYSGAPQLAAVGFRSAQWRKFEGRGTSPLLRELVSSRSRPRTGWVREELTNRSAAQRKQNVEVYICNAVAICLGVRSDTFHRDTPFEELGLDSLGFVTLRRRLQSDLRIAVPISILDHRCSVATLSFWAARELMAEWPESSSPPTSTLIELRSGGAIPPLFLVHAVSGNAAIYQPLASALGRSVWGIENLVPNDSTECPDSIEKIAERYVEMLVQQDPTGPYLIGGWSFGGCLALEVAQGLRRRGSDVPLVVMMDAYHPSLSSKAEGRAMMARTLLLGNIAEAASSTSALKETDLRSRLLAAQLLIADLSHQTSVNPRARLLAREGLERAVRFAAHCGADFEKRLLTELGASGIFGTIEMDEALRLLATYQASVVALSEYRPKYYDGTVLLVRAASAAVAIADAGWRDVVKDLQVRFTDGDHFSIIRQPHVEQMAKIISGFIEDSLLGFSIRLPDPRADASCGRDRNNYHLESLD